jgi:outer membrane receptor for ferrienterochelin and colicins
MKTNIFISLLIIFYSTTLFSQGKTDANIVGHVTGNAVHIPFATVSVIGTTIGVNTDETGHYQLINLPIGTFTIRAQSVGYKPSEKEITTKAGTTIEIKFELEPDVLGLEEVVITADRGEMKRVESPSIVNTLSPRLFETTQSVTLSQTLNFTPGLRVENNCQNCGFSQVRMNGMEGPYSQILINSRPIFSGLAGVYGLELIPSNMIERIEVVRGGGSALYGSNAIAGTINIILKEPTANSYEVGLNTGLTGLAVNGSGGAAADYSANFNTSLVSADSKTGVALYGFSRERKPFDANNDGFSEIPQMNNLTLGSRLFHRFGVRSKLDIDLFNIKEERNGGNKQDYPLHERDVAEAIKHDVKTGAITFEQYFRNYDLLSVFFSAQFINRDSYYGANHSLEDYGNTKDLTYNSGIQYKAVFAGSTIIAGIERTGDFLTDKKLGYPDYSNALIINDSIVSVAHTENTIVADQSSATSGCFVQYELKLSKLKIGLGGRYSHYVIKDNSMEGETNKGNVFSPRVNIMYKVFESLQARISYSQGYRAPQIFDEDLHIETSGSRQVHHVNDPDLRQETSHSIMASLDFNRLIGTVTTGFLIEGFYTRLANPFVSEIGVPDENGEVFYTRKNAKNGATVKGINIELKLKPLKNFSFNSGFTVQSSNYDVIQQFDQTRFFRTPDSYGFFTADWDFAKSLRFSTTGNYTGKMLIPYFGPLADSDLGVLHESNSFFDLGIKLSWNIKLNGAILQLYSGLKNLFNSYQSDFDSGINRDPGYIYGPISPRTVYFGIKIGNMLK